MIVALTTPAHTYTFTPLGRFPWFTLMSYAQAFHARRLPRATYLFCDLDRLGYWELELASRLHRFLATAGTRVLNDPARVRQRHAMLRRLKNEGLNAFDVWLPDAGEFPDRFPVFLRTQASHRGHLTELLADAAEAKRALEAAIDAGYPRKDLMFVEYCAEPNAAGVYRKLSMYRLGERMIPSTAVHERHWAAKYGEIGLAGEDGYRDELEIIRTERYAPEMQRVFDAAEIDYGRADFAIVGGSLQTYEVNTNPTLREVVAHPSPLRMQAQAEVLDRLIAGFMAIDTVPAGPAVVLDQKVFRQQRRRDRFRTYIRWTA